MRSKCIALVSLLAVPALAPAQDEPRETASARFDRLQAKVRAAVDAWREEQRAAAASSERGVPAVSMTPPYAQFVPEFRAAATAHAGRDGAIPFLVWLATYARSDRAASGAAVEALIGDHLDSAELIVLPGLLGGLRRTLGDDAVARALAEMIEHSPHDTVRARAIFCRAAPVVQKAEVGSEEYEAAKRELARAAALVDDEDLASRVRGIVDGRERLIVGGTAPDIEGVDLDGVEFKLSDYAGKVVMLDFWGDW